MFSSPLSYVKKTKKICLASLGLEVGLGLSIELGIRLLLGMGLGLSIILGMRLDMVLWLGIKMGMKKSNYFFNPVDRDKYLLCDI